MHGNPAFDRPQAVRQALSLGDVDDVFAHVVSRCGEQLHVLVAGQNQRPFELQHQRARGHQCHHVVALGDPRPELGGDGLGIRRHLVDGALLEERHAAAARIDDLGLDPVLGQHRARRHRHVRVAVIDEAGGVEHGLAAEGRRLLVERGHRLRSRASRRSCRWNFGSAARRSRPAIFSSTGRVSLFVVALAQLASGATSPASWPLRSVLASSRSARRTRPALRRNRAVAQHQVRKIEVEGVRRHVGALRHEAHVAERAGIDHLAEVGASDAHRARRVSDWSIRSKRRGKESQRLKQRRQPWQMSKTRRISASSLSGS